MQIRIAQLGYLSPWSLTAPRAAGGEPVDVFTAQRTPEELAALASGTQGVRSARMARALISETVKPRHVRQDLLWGAVPGSLQQLESELQMLRNQPRLELDPIQVEPYLDRLQAGPMSPEGPRVLVQAARVLKDTPWGERCLQLLDSWHQAGQLTVPADWKEKVLRGEIAVRGTVLDDSPPPFATPAELKNALQQPLPDPRFWTLAGELSARGWMGWSEEALALVPQALARLADACPERVDPRFVTEQMRPVMKTPFSNVNWETFRLMAALADSRPELDGAVAETILEGDLRFGLNDLTADFLARAAARGWRPDENQRDLLLSVVELPELHRSDTIQYNWMSSARALKVLNALQPEILDQARLALPDGTLLPARESVLQRVLGSSVYSLGCDLARHSGLAAELGRAGQLDPEPLVSQLSKTVRSLAPGDLLLLPSEQVTALGLLCGCREQGVIASENLDRLLHELLVRNCDQVAVSEILQPVREQVLSEGKQLLLKTGSSPTERIEQAASLLEVAVCGEARPGQAMPHQDVLDCLELGLKSESVDPAAWKQLAESPMDAGLRRELLGLLTKQAPIPALEVAFGPGRLEQLSHQERCRFLVAERLSSHDPATRVALRERVVDDLETFGGHVQRLGQSYDFVQDALSRLASEEYRERLARLEEPGLGVGELLARTEECLKLVGRGRDLLDFQVYPQLLAVWRGQNAAGELVQGPMTPGRLLALSAQDLNAEQRTVLLPEMLRSTPTEHARNELLEPHRRAEYQACRRQLTERAPGGSELVDRGAALASHLPEFETRVQGDRLVTPKPPRAELVEAWLGLPLTTEADALLVQSLARDGAVIDELAGDLERILPRTSNIERACQVYRAWQELKAQGLDSEKAFQRALLLDVLDSPADLPAAEVEMGSSHVQVGAVRLGKRRARTPD